MCSTKVKVCRLKLVDHSTRDFINMHFSIKRSYLFHDFFTMSLLSKKCESYFHLAKALLLLNKSVMFLSPTAQARTTKIDQWHNTRLIISSGYLLFVRPHKYVQVMHCFNSTWTSNLISTNNSFYTETNNYFSNLYPKPKTAKTHRSHLRIILEYLWFFNLVL